ncbi:sugar phosphate isomerase/epimerase [Ktedonosporobacter rubrisoli]|uniref:Sugar phosphate isomerase/epimerase n=1 Tax=Ktedonosporobacter rubrisoli TaxID=2509675 RepID=A0A4P6JU67_KTERU|nr:TIM barrel protein [Ktedonosporobacter rubrisoli]QBD78476.1 sugar phosphate isomerase/epimerase [Ktedonosporobacter rubrisoli]
MSKTVQLLCSTGAFSHYPDFTSHEMVLEYGPQLGIDALELMFYPSWYPRLEQVATDLQRSGLQFPVIHAEKNVGIFSGKVDTEQQARAERELAANCYLGSLLGSRVLVLHLWGWPEFDAHLEHDLQALPQFLDIARQHDIELAIETIPCKQADPLTNIQRVLACDMRSRVALDTEFLATHKQIEEVFTHEWLWSERYVRHVHIKDFDGQPFTATGQRRYLHPGEGSIDFTRFFAQLKQHSFDGFISLEASAIDNAGRVNINTLRESLSVISNLLA